jgi:hypothetical protein
MAKVGVGEASALSPDGVSMPMARTVIALCSTSNAYAHGEGLNAKGCHHDRKRGGYHCHRGGGSSSRSDAVSSNSPAPSWIAPVRVSRDPGAFSNCEEARAAGRPQ